MSLKTGFEKDDQQILAINILKEIVWDHAIEKR